MIRGALLAALALFAAPLHALEAGDHDVRLKVGPLERHYVLHVPARLARGAAGDDVHAAHTGAGTCFPVRAERCECGCFLFVLFWLEEKKILKLHNCLPINQFLDILIYLKLYLYLI